VRRRLGKASVVVVVVVGGGDLPALLACVGRSGARPDDVRVVSSGEGSE
jgi:hypothetical protein